MPPVKIMADMTQHATCAEPKSVVMVRWWCSWRAIWIEKRKNSFEKVKQEITPPIAGPVAAEQIIIMGSAAAFGNINDNNEFCDDEC